MVRILSILILIHTCPLFGRNLSGPVYMETFDRSAGGTVLTRASREGILFGNPALLGLGKAWIRWAGMQTNIKISGDREKAQAFIDGLQGEGDTEGASEQDALFSQLENIDLGLGIDFSFSLLNQNGGGAIFTDPGIYLLYDKFGNAGIPGARIAVDAIAGAAVSAAFSPFRWLYIGATQKQLYGIEKNILATPLNYETAAAEVQDLSSMGQGQGTDIGALIFFQDYTIDYSLGLTMKNLSPVVFTDELYPSLPSTKNLGLGLTVHTESSAIHFSGEIHDIDGNSEEPLSRRLHAGVRVLVWGMFGFAAGINNDLPSYGLKLNLILTEIGLNYYNRVIGFGEESFIREEASLTFSFGF